MHTTILQFKVKVMKNAIQIDFKVFKKSSDEKLKL